jgi:hypothetical protein
MADRAAHEIRNPLNGLAVSLEVVRSRAARGGADVASVSRFADLAAGELERAAELVQALVELARPVSVPVDLWSALLPMVTLHHALAKSAAAASVAEGRGGEDDAMPGSVTLEPRGSAALNVATDPLIARAALAAALEAAASARVPARVSCSVEARDEGRVVALLRCGRPAPPLEASVRGALEEGGVRLETVPDGMMLFFRAAVRE